VRLRNSFIGGKKERLTTTTVSGKERRGKIPPTFGELAKARGGKGKLEPGPTFIAKRRGGRGIETKSDLLKYLNGQDSKKKLGWAVGAIEEL